VPICWEINLPAFLPNGYPSIWVGWLNTPLFFQEWTLQNRGEPDTQLYSLAQTASYLSSDSRARVIKSDGLIFDATSLIDEDELRAHSINDVRLSAKAQDPTIQFVWHAVPESAIEAMEPHPEGLAVMSALLDRAIAYLHSAQLDADTAGPVTRQSVAPRL
jgi:hypothetical protein